MSPCGSNWCMLSKQAWSVEEHASGEEWTIEKIHQIRHNVEVCRMEEKPSNVMGCIKRPLIDSVSMKNFIVCILHFIIGIGKYLLNNVFYEWIE